MKKIAVLVSILFLMTTVAVNAFANEPIGEKTITVHYAITKVIFNDEFTPAEEATFYAYAMFAKHLIMTLNGILATVML